LRDRFKRIVRAGRRIPVGADKICCRTPADVEDSVGECVLILQGRETKIQEVVGRPRRRRGTAVPSWGQVRPNWKTNLTTTIILSSLSVATSHSCQACIIAQFTQQWALWL